MGANAACSDATSHTQFPEVVSSKGEVDAVPCSVACSTSSRDACAACWSKGCDAFEASFTAECRSMGNLSSECQGAVSSCSGMCRNLAARGTSGCFYSCSGCGAYLSSNASAAAQCSVYLQHANEACARVTPFTQPVHV